MNEFTIYCTKCKLPIDNSDKGINNQVHASCQEAFDNFIPPATCMFCFEILDQPGICQLCKLGNYRLGGRAYQIIFDEDGNFTFEPEQYREPFYSHIYHSIDEFREEKVKEFITIHYGKSWQIATKFLGLSKETGLKKREYLLKKYTFFCSCKYCKPRKSKSNKGKKKLDQKKLKFNYQDMTKL